MEVRFTHPRTSSSYLADVSPLLTAKQALKHLMSSVTGPFLSPLQQGETYDLTLRRSNITITPNMTMKDAGVTDNDILDIIIGGQGASHSSAIIFS